MTDKPRIRVPAGSSKSFMTHDSFQNFAARVGIGTDNLQSQASYGFNPITRNRQLLEWMYGGSWIVGQCVDAVADDMTRAGISITSPGDPKEVEQLEAALHELGVWPKLTETVKWSRLYGGAIAVMLIEGQKLSTPLSPKTVGRGQFRGLCVLDRWMINPSLSERITAMGPDLGEPKFYDVTVDGGPLPRGRIHHSRIIRLDGIPQPYWRKIAENGWGLSVIEPLYDRLVAFDSTTQGAAQLVFKAHLRTMSVDKLREIIAVGGKAMEGLAKQMDMIRAYQSNEGLTLIDATDKFETHSYTFTGLDDVLLQFGQQLSGAMRIPLVRLFGQSPAGLNATGESDLRNYYDGIASQQEARLRRPFTTLLEVLHLSVLGSAPAEGFTFAFTPLWQLSDAEKSDITGKITTAINDAFDAGVIDKATALKELRRLAQITGAFSSITDEDIVAAEEEPAPTLGEGGDEKDDGDGAEEDKPPVTKDNIANFAVQGLRIVIETPKGAMRAGTGWEATMAAHYGYIQGTWSAEGRTEEMDCFVGSNLKAPNVWVIDQLNPATGKFDEHKCMLGYDSIADAVRDYIASYSDQGFERIAAVTPMTMDAFKAWLKDGHLDRPLARAA